MVEHVGHRHLAQYFAQAYRVLRPGGLFLSHGIVTVDGARPKSLTRQLTDWLWRGRGFIKHYVFPDSELLPLGEHALAAERAGFESRGWLVRRRIACGGSTCRPRRISSRRAVSMSNNCCSRNR